jgi:CBS-domain-containing membrane protein
LGLMERHRVRRLPVVDDDGFVAGIVVERDLLIAADRYLNSPVDVARIMTRNVVTVGEATPVVDAAMLMVERKIGGLPVVDASRKLLGIITETDMLNALAAILRRAGPDAAVTARSGHETLEAKPSARKKSAPRRPVTVESTTKARTKTAGKAKPKPKPKPKAKAKAKAGTKIRAKAGTQSKNAKAPRRRAPAARARSR